MQSTFLLTYFYLYLSTILVNYFYLYLSKISLK